jgi:hypothetical protein
MRLRGEAPNNPDSSGRPNIPVASWVAPQAGNQESRGTDMAVLCGTANRRREMTKRVKSDRFALQLDVRFAPDSDRIAPTFTDLPCEA